MKQAETYTLSDADLELVQGGNSAPPPSSTPDDSSGEPSFRKPVAGEQTPPIIIIDAPVA